MIKLKRISHRTAWPVTVLILLFASVAMGSQDVPNVTGFLVRAEENQIQLSISGPIEYGYFPLSNPDRLIFDFPNAILTDGEGQAIDETVERASFSMVRIFQFSPEPPIVRLVIYLNGPSSPIVNYSPSSGRLTIEVAPDGWELAPIIESEPVRVTASEEILPIEPASTNIAIPDFIPEILPDNGANRANIPGYEIQSNREETHLRFPWISVDDIEIEQLRFPDRLHVRIFTKGPVDIQRPRFEPYANGNIWNEVAKQWRSFIDRDDNGIVDLTIYLYPNIGYMQSIGADRIPEIRLFALPPESIIADENETEISSVEIEVASYGSDETETVEEVPEPEIEIVPESVIEIEPEIVVEPQIETDIEPEIEITPEISVPVVENPAPETPVTRQNLLSGMEIEILETETVDTVEVIENASFLIASADNIIKPESNEDRLGDSVNRASGNLLTGDSSGLPIISSRNNIIAEMAGDPNRMVMRTGDVVVVPVRGLVRASIGNPEVATLNVISQEEILVTALSQGNTTLLIW
ncbi:MAG TPA: AMIN domain-containing protein, partial [Firmicutes bacterium]|nr:AMIN domain-containing protein [Bacillota bacterium]